MLVFTLKSHNPYSRLGVIVPKTVIKQAVTRNTYKRLIRESFRKAQNSLKGLELLILIRSNYIPANKGLKKPGLDKKTFRVEIDQLWQQLTLT